MEEVAYFHGSFLQLPSAMEASTKFMEIQPEGGKAFRGARLPGGEGADAAGSVITAESSHCKVLVGRGARWATIIAAAGASAEPWSSPDGTTKK